MYIVKHMPVGGGYDSKTTGFKALQSSIDIRERVSVDASKVAPTFCSASTYVVFLKLISQLQNENKLKLSSAAQQALFVGNQPDGSGVWGRWNANGPGTARLFYELGLGTNFTFDRLSDARPGDFVKIFWSDEIGAKEHGHSVIFTGTRQAPEGRQICFWSSNSASKTQPAGMGEKCLSETKIHRAVFSRLQSLENINQVEKKMAAGSSTYSDAYLAAMLKRASTPEEMCAEVGCQ